MEFSHLKPKETSIYSQKEPYTPKELIKIFNEEADRLLVLSTEPGETAPNDFHYSSFTIVDYKGGGQFRTGSQSNHHCAKEIVKEDFKKADKINFVLELFNENSVMSNIVDMEAERNEKGAFDEVTVKKYCEPPKQQA